jgi:DNA-binding XRE family transcriptional regulator
MSDRMTDDDDFDSENGPRSALGRLRHERKLTRVATAALVGCSPSTIWAFERGYRPRRLAQRIARTFDVPVEILLSDEPLERGTP